MTHETFGAGCVVCAQGEAADRMFLIMEGSCTVTLAPAQSGELQPRHRVQGRDTDGPRVVGQLGMLDVFGESALFGKKPVRNATVTADADGASVLVLSRSTLSELIKAGHLNRQWAVRLKMMHEARKREIVESV